MNLIKEFLVGVKQSNQVDVLIKVIVPASHVVHHSHLLFISCTDDWRQQTVDAQDLSLFQLESHSLQTDRRSRESRHRQTH